jgi:hypothetical protein
VIRGGFDFEAWEWENPLCCAFVWGPVRDDGTRAHEYLTDQAPYVRPDALVNASLVMLRSLTVKHGVREWWAHNMGRYDGLIIIDAARRVGWKASATCANGRPVTMTLTPPNSPTIHLKDTFCLAPSKLEELAVEWQLPSRKLFKKATYKVDPRLWDPDERRRGCVVDAQLALELAEKVESIAQEWGVKKLRSTFSGIALASIRSDLEARGLQLPSHKEQFDFLDMTRPGYLGGRVEIFHHVPPWWLCEHDISSSYPASMCNVLPWNLIGESEHPRYAKRILKGEYGG